MATTLWDQEITKHVDWGGDESTGRNPVSGKYVQKFIKDTLETKMGWLEYDRANNRYMVFADEENKDLYLSNPTEYNSLLLGQFSAPAPAFLNIINGDPYNTVQTGTFLVGVASIPVDFGYSIESSSGAKLQEAVTMRVTMTRSGEVQSFVKTLAVDFEHYQDETGVPVHLDLADYLTIDGTYDITITLTSQQTNVSSFLNLRYKIIDLQFDCSGFDNTKAVPYEDNLFYVPFIVTGAAGSNKILQIYIDGEPYYQDKLGYGTLALSHESDLKGAATISDTITFYRTPNNSTDAVKWPELGEAWGNGTFQNASLAGKEVFSSGKHTLQLAAYIVIQETGEKVYTLTKYFDFIIGYPASDTSRHTFIMYQADLESGKVFDPSETITFSAKQYESTSFTVSVYDSADRDVPVIYNLVDEEENLIDKLEHTVSSGSTDTFNYNFMTAGQIMLHILDGFTNTEHLKVLLDVAASTADVGETGGNNLFVKYSALNRSNTESNHSWTNMTEYGNQEQYKFEAIFDRVLWNKQSGWTDDGALVLKNGATVTFPFNLFESTGEKRVFTETGMTFEIEFETSDIKRDDAEIMNFHDSVNNSYIKITATEAEICTQNKVALRTNFKDNERIKIAFVFNPIAAVDDSGRYRGNLPNPNLLFIIVNGVLDRVCRWGDGKNTNSDSVKSNNTSFTIGNTTGDVTTKLYSLRVYRTALTPEDEYKNYEYDGGADLINRYNRNKIVVNNEINLDAVREVIPTLLLSGDYQAVNTAKKKKENIMANLQFWDPTDPTRNFFCRDAYVSCQGTSSMNYPIKNLRPYFCKKPSTKEGEATFDRFKTTATGETIADLNIATPQMETEFWPVSEYRGHEDEVETWVDENCLPFGTNKKIDDEGNHAGYHRIGANCTPAYRQRLAEQWAAVNGGKDIYGNNEYIYKATGMDGKKVAGFEIVNPAEDPITTSGTSLTNYYYISQYRPVRLHDATGEVESDDDYWKRLKEYRYAGVKLYTRTDTVDEEGKITVTYKEAKKKKDKLDVSKQYYVLSSWWKQYEKSGWTDRWTLKADYAESSMCHNSGTGRLWGQAMKNVTIGGAYVCQTIAQANAREYPDFFDIRTSCDGKPIVLFVRECDSIDPETGRMKYKPAKFAGLFNIMTDKSSTKLFGFEDLYDENAKKVFDASKTQCWECLANGSLIVQGLTSIMDIAGEATLTPGDEYGDGRTIWKDLESRWPDTGYERHDNEKQPHLANYWPDDTYGVESNALESFYNWMHFCKPAINYIVDPEKGIDGYDLSPYVEITDMDQAKAYYQLYRQGLRDHDDDMVAENRLYVQWNNAGNIAYATFGEDYKDDAGNAVEGGLQGATSADDVDAEGNTELNIYQLPNNKNFFKFSTDIKYEVVSKTVNTETIGEYFQRTMNISTHIYLGHVYSFDSRYRCYDAEGNFDENEAKNYLVDVYMWMQNNKFWYYDNYGNVHQYMDNDGGEPIDRDDYLKINGKSIAQMTFMEYFSATKEEHLDLWKVAAYYVYVIRAGAVDQVIKNTMMTTEDGHSWYFINYDNDTILGVRNDGLLKFNWDFNRDTYDVSGSSYSFAGAKSVLWNTLEQDADFLSYVQQIDNAMSSSDLFSVKAVLEMYNEKQEGTWCERLYNEQEQIKYLSTFKDNFDTDKYLGFMHGTRHSHRTWWVNKRWELYDAMWNSGKYSQRQAKFYVNCTGASINAPVDVVTITPSSKYYFTLYSNTQAIDFVEIDPNDEDVTKRSYTFKALQPYSLGDPMRLLGPDKIQVLDFRKSCAKLSATMSIAEAEILVDGSEEKITWIQDVGSATMTRLLIGNGVDKCNMNNLNGHNGLTSLEEIDLRGINQISSVDVSSLINMHRYRANNSILNSFVPAIGATLYEAALSNQVQKINLEKVRFEAAADDYLVDADHPDWTPVYDENAHKYTPDGIFDYTINENLVEVSLKNVEGFDTQKFVTDWYNFIESRPKMRLSDCTLVIEGVEWNNITVQDLINIRTKFNVPTPASFKGLFNVVGSSETVAGALTPEEYEQLIDVFSTEAFKPGAATQINVAAGMFFDPTTTAYTVSEDTNGEYTQVPGAEYYNVVRGTRFEVNATIFPVSEDLKYEYQLQSWNSQAGAWRNVQSITGTHPNRIYNDPAPRVILTNVDNKAVLIAEEYQWNQADPFYRIRVADTTVTPNIDYSGTNSKYIYVRVLNQVLPKASEINVQENGITINEIKDANEHEYSVNFGTLHDSFNVTVNRLTISLSANSNIVSDGNTTISNITIDNDNHEYKFTMKTSIQESNYDLPLYITAEFNTTNELNKKQEKTYTVQVTTIYADAVEIYDDNDNLVTSLQSLNQTGNVYYTVKLLPENYNVPIASISSEDSYDKLTLTNDPEDINRLKLIIANNVINNKYTSFVTHGEYTIDVVPTMGAAAHTLHTTLNVHAGIVYPERLAVNTQVSGSNVIKQVMIDQQSMLTVLDSTACNATATIKVMPPVGSVASEDITERYTVALSNVNITSSDPEADPATNVTITTHDGVYDPATETDTPAYLEISVAAESNMTTEFDVTFNYSLEFDQDDTNDPLINDMVSISGTARYKIARTLANANEVKDLIEGEWYAVDYKGSFYQLTNSGEYNQLNSLMKDSSLTPEQIIGIGTVKTVNATKTPLFMAFDNMLGGATGIDYSILSRTGTLFKNISRVLNSNNGISSLNECLKNNLYDGYKITRIFNNSSEFTNDNGYQNTLLYKTYHMFDNVTDCIIKGYLPSFNEMEALSLEDYAKFEALCDELVDARKIAAYTKIVFGDVNDKYYATASLFETSPSYGESEGIMWVLASFREGNATPTAAGGFSYGERYVKPFLKVD